ncbi:helix-turn-helix transcriptional regulator [Herbiconiux sp. YIM B11900]|uniref:helix-turn-helix transcriptional regulator n=1 Tax=Herbiconiux sp. YIM B11900 TaxID=3404131 RepID=UPI003F84CC7F
MDRTAFGEFLRTRREALQPEDVGLRRGSRRRTSGLRREEVAELSDMSADYLARLERGDGPQPSEQMVAAIARGLRLTIDERDHLFLLAGLRPPGRSASSEHVSPGLMRILDRLADTPAQIMGSLGETIVQTPPAVALLGDQTRHTGRMRSSAYRWFADPASRDIYPPEDQPRHARVQVAQLRRAAAQRGADSEAAEMVRHLLATSSDFAALWAESEVGLRYTEEKRFAHPEVGELSLYCQVVYDPDQAQSLLVFTATPGSPSADKLALLVVLGAQVVAAG